MIGKHRDHVTDQDCSNFFPSPLSISISSWVDLIVPLQCITDIHLDFPTLLIQNTAPLRTRLIHTIQFPIIIKSWDRCHHQYLGSHCFHITAVTGRNFTSRLIIHRPAVMVYTLEGLVFSGGIRNVMHFTTSQYFTWWSKVKVSVAQLCTTLWIPWTVTH